MKQSLIMMFSLLVLLTSCDIGTFRHLQDNFIEDQIAAKYPNPTASIYTDALLNKSFYLGITLQDTFLGGELTFTQKSEYDIKVPTIQFCYLLLDNEHNVVYNTVAIDNILDTLLIPKIPAEVSFLSSKKDSLLAAMVGRYVVSNDTLKMLLQSREQEELVEINARISHDSTMALEFLTVTRKRLNFSPLISRKATQKKQKIFEVKTAFSIDLIFKEIPNNANRNIYIKTKTSGIAELVE